MGLNFYRFTYLILNYITNSFLRLFLTKLLCQSAFCHCEKIPEIKILKEESSVLAHGFRSFSLWLLGPCHFGACSKAEHHGVKHVVEQSCSPHGDLEAEKKRKGPRSQYLLQGHTLNDPTSFTRFHLLKILPVVPQAGNHMSHWGHLRFKP